MNEIGDIDQRIMELVSLMPDTNKYQFLRMLEDWRQGQNRDEYREECLIPVDISFRDRVYRDFISNYSDSGAFIETREAFVKGQPISLAFSAQNGQKHYKIIGTVVRRDDKGVAVKFHRKIKRLDISRDLEDLGPLFQIIKGSGISLKS